MSRNIDPSARIRSDFSENARQIEAYIGSSTSRSATMNKSSSFAMEPAARDAPGPRFLRMPSVVRMTGLARSTIYRLIAEKKFPQPVRVGDRAVAWRQVDIDRWSDERLPATH